jgi:hypothetical protein
MKHQSFWPLPLALVLWVGCSSSGGAQKGAGGEQKMGDAVQSSPTPSQSPRPYSKSLEELKASFNRDKGKVRLVTLLSPT